MAPTPPQLTAPWGPSGSRARDLAGGWVINRAAWPRVVAVCCHMSKGTDEVTRRRFLPSHTHRLYRLHSGSCRPQRRLLTLVLPQPFDPFAHILEGNAQTLQDSFPGVVRSSPLPPSPLCFLHKHDLVLLPGGLLDFITKPLPCAIEALCMHRLRQLCTRSVWCRRLRAWRLCQLLAQLSAPLHCLKLGCGSRPFLDSWRQSQLWRQGGVAAGWAELPTQARG